MPNKQARALTCPISNQSQTKCRRLALADSSCAVLEQVFSRVALAGMERAPALSGNPTVAPGTVAMTHSETRRCGRLPRLGDILVPECNSFGAVRLAMAVAVLISHCFYLATGSSRSEPLVAWSGYTLGQHGVQVFFIVSGILVAQSFARSRDAVEFTLARALRILPGLAVCIGLSALVLGPAVSTLSMTEYFADADVPRYMVKTMLLTTGSAPLPGVFEANPSARLVNLSLWTLKYEVVCYVALALVGGLLVKLRSKPAISAVLALGACLILYKRPELRPDNTFSENVRYFALFFSTGAGAYLLRAHIPVTWMALPPLVALFMLSIGSYWTELACAALLGYAAIWAASFRMPAVRFLTADRDYSYGVYIFGVPVTQTLLQLHPSMPVSVLIAATAAVAVLLAGLSWRLVERPALGLRSRLASLLRADHDRKCLRPVVSIIR